MSFLKSLFGKKKTEKVEKKNKPKSSSEFKISHIERLTEEAVKVTFEVPLLLKEQYLYQPGQYLDLDVNIDGKTVRRSYSICSDVTEPLSIGVKEIEDGYVSKYFNQDAKIGHKIKVSVPKGSFIINEVKGKFVGIAAGSGITPVLSIAKMINRTEGAEMDLIFGNRDEASIMFKNELEELQKINIQHIYSEQEKEGILYGMMTEDVLTNVFENSPLLEADGFYICGPEPVILNTKNVLEKLGVPSDKIYFELFTTPVNLESKSSGTNESDFNGIAQVKVILDDEFEEFELATDGDTILEEAESYGMDAPYSCRGGICSTCKGKVLEGSASMDKNYTLSDEEVAEGYILTCQAHPTSSKVVVSYDE